MLLNNEFTCPNNHTFNANAKIRARCPQCGQTARRDFTASPPVNDTKSKEPKKPVERTTLIRQGRPPRMASLKKRFKKPSSSKLTKTTSRAKAPTKTIAKKTGLVAKTANGLVKQRKLTGKVMPTVKRAPSKTAVARHVSDGAPRRHGSYFDEVIDKYGRL